MYLVSALQSFSTRHPFKSPENAGMTSPREGPECTKPAGDSSEAQYCLNDEVGSMCIIVGWMGGEQSHPSKSFNGLEAS